MQECGTSTGNESNVKRVSVRSGGAGHAHSGVAKTQHVPPRKVTKPTLPANNKIVRLGR
jgi:hypothetical protein